MRRAAEEGDPAEQPPRRQRKSEEGPGVFISILPTDVLLLVFARLTAVDLIRAGAVCVSWRKTVKSEGRPPPRAILPWLIIAHDLTAADDRCGFFDPNTGKTYRIHLPGFHGIRFKRVTGRSDDGFLVYKELFSDRLTMIYPITGATIVFPPLPALQGDCSYVLVIRAATGYTVVAHSLQRVLFLAFADAGNLETWGRMLTILDGVAISGLYARGKKLFGCFYQHEGNGCFCRFFSCDLDDPTDFRVWAFRLRRPFWSLADFGGSFPHHRGGDCGGNRLEKCFSTKHYPLALPNGDLIVVFEAFTSGPTRTIGVKVYGMPTDLDGEAKIVTSIGNHALFLDIHGAIVLSTLESPELRSNTIYFGNQCRNVSDAGAGWSSDDCLVMFDMQAQSFPIPVENYYHYSSWFVPGF